MAVILSPEEQAAFDAARRTGDLSPFTERFFRLPLSGSWYTPEDRVEQYGMLHDLWTKQGKPDAELQAKIEGTTATLLVSWDPYYMGEPMFLLRHGFLTLPWIKEFISPAINLGLAITGTGTGKTASVAVAMLAYAAIYPGSRWLNVAPTSYQASLMLGEVSKWCAKESPFRRFIVPSRGAHELWVERPHPVITVEVYDGYPSTFTCQTVGLDASGILGGEYDWINCDEAALLGQIEVAEHKLGTRLRGTRATGELRWGKLTWITNPAPNPELLALMAKYETLMSQGHKDIVVLEGLTSDSNPYVTKRQLARQRRTMSEHEANRWHGGQMSAAMEGMGINPRLLEACRVYEMDELVAAEGHTDDFGVRKYMFMREAGHNYLVTGDPGKTALRSLSSQNVPVITTWDVTHFLEPFGIKLVGFEWMDGDGSYNQWIEIAKRHMLFYRAPCFYDAGNVQSAFEDLAGGFGGTGFDWPTQMVFFGGSVAIKRWAVTIMTQLMQDQMFAWPYIKGLWHQARIFNPGKKNLADDIIASVLVLCRAFQIEGVFWDKLALHYRWTDEGEYESQDDGFVVTNQDDRHARMGV